MQTDEKTNTFDETVALEGTALSAWSMLLFEHANARVAMESEHRGCPADPETVSPWNFFAREFFSVWRGVDTELLRSDMVSAHHARHGGASRDLHSRERSPLEVQVMPRLASACSRPAD